MGHPVKIELINNSLLTLQDTKKTKQLLLFPKF